MPLIRVDQFDEKSPAEIVTLSVGGNTWELDLSTESERQLYRDLERYTSAGRRISSKSKKSTPSKKSNATMRPAVEANIEKDVIREWARGKGMKVADRGRVPKDVVDAFEAAHAPNASQPAFSGA